MTSIDIDFNENAFVYYLVKKYLNDEEDTFDSNDDLFDDYFKTMFPTEEICEAIRLKFYSGKEYKGLDLYSILYNKVDYSYDKEIDSDLSTINEDEEELFEDYYK